MANLIIVSNRLPMKVQKTNGKLVFSSSDGGLATGLSPYTKRPGTKWIGWPGLPSDDLTEADKKAIARELKKQRCYPLFLSQKQIDDFYSGYSNGVLWPTLHELPVRPHSAKLWAAYKEVNALYSEAVVQLGKPGSTVWVHDYQLMLVPQQLRRTELDYKIGFFLHTPFPTFKTFAATTEAKQLLRGLLGADLVGFHTRGYTKQFIETCDQLLNLPSEHGQILLGGRSIRATEFPIGIDYGRFVAATKQRGNRAALAKLRRQYRGKKIIVAVDRLDPSKGLDGRLKAYRMLLKQHLELHGKVVLIMIVSPSRTDVPEYQAVKKKLDVLVQKIESEFGSSTWQPVDFIYETVPLDRVTQYYQIANVAFIAPVRDGMNLVAKEFIASKRKNDGVLVLSETAGAAEQLRDAILVNPAKPQTMVDGLMHALTMPRRELRRRAREMQELIKNSSVQKWAENFMDTLQKPRSTASLRVRTINQTIEQQLVSAYEQAQSRLILLDYDGVLRTFEPDPALAKPTSETLHMLERMGKNAKNDVMIISGRSETQMQAWLGKLPVALAAEHGAIVRNKPGENWHHTTDEDTQWHKQVIDLFEYYASLTPGAHVEHKTYAVVWHYRNSSPYYAQKYLVALRRLLKPIVKTYGLDVLEGNKILEVRPKDVTKRRPVQEWLARDHDFVLCIGDDATDEDMFAVMPPHAYSIKVGRGRTLAHFRLKDVSSVHNLLKKL